MKATTVPQRDELLEISTRLVQLPEDRQQMFLRRLIERGVAPSRLPIVPFPRTGPLPLSYAQSRLWFLWKLEPRSPAYNLHRSLRLTGRLGHAALERAFTALVARHEALRTRFREEEGEARQLIAPPAPVAVPVEDLSGLSEDFRAAELLRITGEETARPFDLTMGPLLRLRLLRLAEGEHRLLVTMHHIVSDAWSMNVAMDEFARLYAAFREGREAALPPLPIQYADHALWQRRLVEAGEIERQRAYWLERLAGSPPVLELPTDHPRPAVPGGRGASLAFTLEADLTAGLRRLTQARGASLFTLLLGTFQILLHRYTGQEDVRVGVPVAGRGRAETEGVIGFFVNTQVLRSRVTGEQSVDELLAELRRTVREAQANQDLPFEQLVEALRPERSLSGSPLFQVVHNHLTQGAEPRKSLPGLAVEMVETPLKAIGFDLALDTAEATDGTLRGSLSYATELFREETAARLRDHFTGLLREIARAPETRIGNLPMLAPGETAALSSRNRAIAGFDGVFVQQRIAEQARLRPDAPALVCGDTVLSFAELELLSDRLARWLADQGVGPEVRVGVALERSVTLVVTLLAVLKAGGAYVPLDTDYPAERLRFMIEDAGLALLVTSSALRPLLPEVAGPLLVELDALDLSGLPPGPPPLRVRADALAYLVYTSGSTGRPKGVAVTQAPLAMHCRAIGARYGMGPEDRELIFMSFSFDGAHERWITALSHGASVAIRGPELWTPARTLAALRRLGVTVVAFPPAYLQQMAEEAERGAEPPPPVRVYCFGGDAVPEAAFELVRRALAPQLIMNGYGPTETVVTPLLWRAEAEMRCGAAYAPIGERVGDRSGWVLDGGLNPLPPGVAGELYLGGEGLARGYHGRPGLTAERFVPDPFGPPGSRLYRTGDRVRERADGVFEYLGRLDHQVKIRGFRIELGEVEARLAAQPGVREALVVARDAPGGARLVGYVAGAADPDTLRAALKVALPDYMVPSKVVVLERLPVNANGKLDRAALPEPDWAGRSQEPPRTPTEQGLAAIWREVLGVAAVGRNDDFFELGGHSLLGIRVVSRVQDALGRSLELRTLFENPTLEELARAVERLPAGADGAPPLVRRVQPGEEGGEAPASFAQSRMWFLWQLQPDSAAYVLPVALRLAGPLDRAALDRAFAALIGRHESLRTGFAQHGGQVVQRIRAEQPFAPAFRDLSGLPADEIPAAVRRLAEADARAPFDLEQGCLLRATLLRLGGSEHALLIALHHIVTDGWSMGVLVEELCALYAAGRDGAGPALPALPIQYADYALWQRDWLAAGEGDRQLAFWKERLGDAPPVLGLPADHPRPAVQSHRGATHRVVVPAALAGRLGALAQARQATPFLLLLAAFKLLLFRFSGEADLSVGVPFANRQRLETERLIGFFVNTLVLRSRIDGRRSFHELLDEVRRTTLEAQSHQDVPFDQVVEALRPERSLSHNPLFQVMFSHDRRAPSSISDSGAIRDLGDLRVEGLDSQAAVAQFDLSLHGEERADGSIGFTFTYATDLFAADSVARLADGFLHLLDALAAAPDERLDRLPLIPPAEAARLVRAGMGTPLDPAGALCLHRRFEAQAALRPDAVALRFEGRSLTYGELNARANRLAWHLRDLGVGPDRLVGLAVERSFDTVLGILAILKAGGAYLPLDPSYPPERLAYTMRDSGAGLLLTQEWLLPVLPAGAGRVWCLDRDGQELEGGRQDDPPPVGGPDSLAYCIYTSGSTGQPKGALLTHRNVDRLLRATEADFGFSEADVWTLFHSYAFDFSVWEIFGALCHGGRLVVVPYETSRAPDAFHELLLAEGVTILNQTPSAFQQLSRVALERDRDLPLRCVVFGGEALDVGTLRPWFARFGDRRPQLVNMYGITETTVHVSHRPITAEDASGSPIGRPIGDLSWHLLDAGLEPVPVGVFGEIHIAGDGLARGYHGRPGLTAERFVPDPFGPPGGRLYRTGDLARRRADGTLDYVGRIDQQVKLRGFRIELGEIEARLCDHPAVREAVVLLRAAAAGQQLVGYVVAADVGGLEERLKAHLKAHLPDHMVPARIVALPAMPLTGNGKLDRRALPEPDWTNAAYRAPGTPAERTLAGIWQEVLELPRIGLDDNFFDLGGDSIVSIQVVARARGAGLAITPKDLFLHQTIGALAAASAPLAEAPASAPTAVETEEEEAYPLSPMQQGMLFHTLQDQGQGEGRDQGGALYINQMSVGVRGLDAPRFRAAWQRVFAHHDILSTGFRWEGVTAPSQRVHADLELPFRELDWRGRADDAAALAALAAAERAEGFDPARPPLMRLLLVRLGEDRHRLIWTYHHALLDGWSVSRLIGDVLRLYKGEALAPAPRYRDYIAWLGRQDAAAGEGFWRERLAALEEPTLLAGAVTPRPPADRSGHQALYTRLDADRTARLQAFAQQQRVTMNTLVQGAWLLLLHRYTGQDTVCFGATMSGRPAVLPGAESMLGLFINTLPVIRRLVADQALGDWLRALQAENIEIREQEHTPLSDIQRWAGRGGQALFDSILVFENQPIDRTLKAWNDRDLRFEEAADAGVTNVPMDLMVTLDGGRLEIEYMFLRASFEPEAVERIRAGMEGLLDRMAADPDRRLGALGLAPADELAALSSRNAPVAGFDGVFVQQRIAEQARLRPDAPALVCGDTVLSFAELELLSDRLARWLADQGVGPEVRVGVALERSVTLVVTLLAVLKAGGAYVPLDTDYPAERLRFMIEDAGLALLVTSSALRPLLPEVAGPLLVELDALDLSGLPPGPPPMRARADALAYLVYTSGSTGRPKGVAVTQAPLAMHCRAIGARYGMGPEDRELIFMSFSFDGAHERWITALTHGASVAIRGPELWTPAQTLAALRRLGVTVVAFPPAYLQQMAEEAERSAEPPPAVRVYCFGGDAVPEAAFELVRRALAPQLIMNGYGPTETVVTPLLWRAEAGMRCGAAYAPIGERVGARSGWVLDGGLNPLPPGVAGELYLGGEGLARGYHGRPGLTAERFVPDPFGPPGSRLYRTGDRVRERADGVFEYLGRLDHQVKIRGFRIELGEVEARLAAQPGVREALVVARDAPGGARLVGYVAGAADPDTLRAALKAALPDYMVPSKVVVLERLPVNANGKLDRAALPEPDWAGRSQEPPRTPTEQGLAAIWREVLGVAAVGRNDNFFELGGDSLLTLKVISRVRSTPELGLTIKLRDMMTKPTIARLCGEGAEAPAGEPQPVIALNRAPADRTPLFCLHAGFGTIFDYEALARRLDGLVPVYGVQCRMLLDPAWRDDSLAAMAGDYARHIRRTAPRGPYRLLGWSLGGSLAVMVADVLRRQGEEVSFLGLVDSFVPGEPQAGDWRAELRGVLGTLRPGLDPDPALIDALADEPDAARLAVAIERATIERAAGEQEAGKRPGWDALGAEELAQAFIVAARLRRLSEGLPALPRAGVAPVCWWLTGRRDAHALLCRQIGEPATTARLLDSSHFRILQERAFLDGLQGELGLPPA